MKKVAIIIKHPFRDFDWRVDVVEVSESATNEQITQAANKAMLGPFEVVAVTDRVNLSRILDMSIEKSVAGIIDTTVHQMD